MILRDYDRYATFYIHHPRYYDRKVLLAANKVQIHNKVIFTQSNSMGKEPYYISGHRIKQNKKESNGKISCYAVPIDELQLLEKDKVRS